MIEQPAVLDTNNHTAAGSKVLSNITTSAFAGMAEAQTEEARAGLQGYLATVTDGKDVSPLTATLTPLNDHATLTMGLQCAYNSHMTPAQYQELHAQLEQALATHPVLSPYKPEIQCEQSADGHVHLKASVVGLNVHDYAHLIQSLAEHQHAHDNHEMATGERHEDAHHTHEKMLVASAGVPEKDLRAEGFAAREKARPVMGALTRAFHLKRRGVPSSVPSEHHDADDVHCDMSSLVDDHHEHLLHHASSPPALSILGGSRVHMGVVHELAQHAVLGSN